MQKTLILIRHGHRDNSRREVDNGLDDKGRDQAKAIKWFFSERFSKDDMAHGLWIVSSPKARCIETLQPLAKAMDRLVDVHPGLDEQNGRESANAFLQRIEHFLNEWLDSKMVLTVACSHGDWLPLAVQKLLGLGQDFKKGAWLEIQSERGVHGLRWYIPTFKPFIR